MKRIIEHGMYRCAECKTCNCKFAFDLVDIQDPNIVICPECEAEITVNVQEDNQ